MRSPSIDDATCWAKMAPAGPARLYVGLFAAPLAWGKGETKGLFGLFARYSVTSSES